MEPPNAYFLLCALLRSPLSAYNGEVTTRSEAIEIASFITIQRVTLLGILNTGLAMVVDAQVRQSKIYDGGQDGQPTMQLL